MIAALTSTGNVAGKNTAPVSDSPEAVIRDGQSCSERLDRGDSDWDRSVASHPQATIFHTTAWGRILNKTYGHTPFRLTFFEGGGTAAMLPMMEVNSAVTGRRGVAMPFSDFCEPLRFTAFDSQTLLQKLVESGRERDWRYFELRGGHTALPHGAVPAERYYGHSLDLTSGPKNLFRRCHSAARRAIRKAEKNHLRVEISSARKAMLDFYQLHAATRRRHGLPPQSLSFFLRIDEEIMKPRHGFIVIVKQKTTPVAAAVFFTFGSSALFKFGASDQSAHDLRGNNLAMWEAIQELVSRQVETLHFGRTALNNSGLRRFKLAWGTKEEPIEYFRFELATGRWVNRPRQASKVYNQVFRSLPLSANRVAGALIYPHLD